MKILESNLLKDNFYLSGMGSILLSALIFLSTNYINSSDTFVLFIVNYACSAFYGIAVFGRGFSLKRWRLPGSRMNYVSIMLVLWFISAFSLNKTINIFNTSSDWLSVYVCLACLAIMLSTIQDYLSIYLRHLLTFFLSAALVLFIYYALYLIPMYALGALAAIFFGFSLHLFIPALLAILTITILKRSVKATPVLKYALVAGILIPLFICSWFSFEWNQLNRSITTSKNQNTLNESNLPEWVVVARQLPKSSITEKFMKADLVYDTFDETSSWFWGDFSRSTLFGARKHDPLIMIASMLSGKTSLNDEDKVKVLKSIFDSRHLAQERLWNGDNLETSNVVSNIKIYPEYRMAYTEKTLSIHNNNERMWRNNQEAIYTFHLPEGAVVSSLSLWIAGKEEKALLTTKGKADSAYKTIVGVESRDPSVLHWQEGNTVSVRVFPCDIEEDRKFRIGITSPLKKENNQLIYENPYFDGPTTKSTEESLQLTFSTPARQIESDFGNPQKGIYRLDRSYKDRWSLNFASPALSDQPFSFGESSYQLKEANLINTGFKPGAIYLDINSSWSEDEFKAVWNSIKAKNVYAFTNKLTLLTADNANEVFQDLKHCSFSLFPFYEIKDPQNALVITKTNEISPNLSDLEGSKFQEYTSTYLAHSKPFYLYNIGQKSNPYLKTLKSFGAFKYSEGDVDKLSDQLQHNQFRTLPEKDSLLNIPGAAMAIEKTKGFVKNQAPDHLLRLYAYNDILKKVGSTYFEKDYVRDDLIKTAEQAFIASPVSSLIVLETQKDYDRFDIEKNKNSLKNASMHSSGAAPEPHEWMLILLTLVIIIYFMYKSRSFNKLKPSWK